MKHILIPVDSSSHAVAAARLGVALARRHGATATLFRALDFTLYTVVAPPVWESYNAERTRHCHAELDALEAELAAGDNAGVSIETVVRQGKAATAIAAYAAEIDADLIAMGTYGANSGEQFLLGSVAARVARIATCPVLVTRADRGAPPPDGVFTHPVVAVDYSKFSLPAVRLAAMLACDNTTIELIHIIHWPGGPRAADINDALTAAREAELERLESFAADIDIAPIAVAVRADLGRAADQILDYVASSKTDVVIVGAHGRDERVSHLGTVADRILRGSTVPVILLPEGSLGP